MESQKVPNGPNRLWTIRDAAQFLSVSMRTVERARHRGEFPIAIRVGRAVRFEPQDVTAWAANARERD
jgi:excisionase family DNA binding protein